MNNIRKALTASSLKPSLAGVCSGFSVLVMAFSRHRPGSPWQNGIAERLIRTLRRECLHHVIIVGEPHLR